MSAEKLSDITYRGPLGAGEANHFAGLDMQVSAPYISVAGH